MEKTTVSPMPTRSPMSTRSPMLVKLSLSFLAGSLVPATALYLTGGSNRFNFLFGLILGLSLTILPILLYPKRLSQWIWSLACAWEQFLVTLRSTSTLTNLATTSTREPRPTPHSQNLEQSIKKDQGQVLELKPGHPYAGDCVSALANLGLALGKSQRLVNRLVSEKEYGSFDELFHDAMQSVKK